MSAPANPDEPGAEQPFISHLIELRERLIRMGVAVLLVFLVLFPFANDIYTLIAEPIMAKLPEGATMIATQVASPFLTPFKLALMVAVFVAMPYLLYQLWAFVAPGLYQHEKRLAVPLLASSILLFYLGMAFAYFLVFPLVFGFFASVTPEGVTQMPDITHYLEFVLKLFFAFGIAFEIPIATILLVMIGVTTPEQLVRQRPYIIVGAFVVGMLLTPPDIFSQTLLAVPMWLLFELGVLFSRFMLRQRAALDQGDEDPSPAAMAAPAAALHHDNLLVNRSPATGDPDNNERFVPLTDDQMEAELDAMDAQEREQRKSGSVAAKLVEVKRLRDTDGDPQQVRRLLYEVLIEGDAGQRFVAQNILEQIDTP